MALAAVCGTLVKVSAQYARSKLVMKNESGVISTYNKYAGV